MALVAAGLAGAAAIGGGAVYIFKSFFDRSEDAVESVAVARPQALSGEPGDEASVAGDLKEFLIKKVWPNILCVLIILFILLLTVIILVIVNTPLPGLYGV